MRTRHLAALLLLTSLACTYKDSVEPPGDVEDFDPIAAYPAVEKYAGEGAKLVSINARYVRSDGTMDLTADYRPSLYYKFVRKRASSGGDGPVGTGTKRRTHESIQVDVREPGWVHTQTISGSHRKETSERHKGMVRGVGPTDADFMKKRAKAPTCSFKKIWAKARKAADVPKDAVAVITYDRAGYEFEVRDLDVELRFDRKCRLKEDSESISPARKRARELQERRRERLKKKKARIEEKRRRTRK